MRKDYSGMRFGRLVAIEPTNERKSNGSVVWLCKCDCGKIVKVPTKELRQGARTKSCGCLRVDNGKNTKTHGGTHERLYGVWMGMRRRCYDPKVKEYRNYGARGISVCAEWHDYAQFRKWAFENGYCATANRFDCTLDRIDPNGNYEPNNCRFVSMSVQDNNKRNSKFITYKGETKTVSEWEHLTGSKKGFIRERLERGWTVEEALSAPPKYNSSHPTFTPI